METNKSLDMFDDQNVHFMHQWKKFEQEIEDRANRHIENADATIKTRRRSQTFKTTNISSDDLSKTESIIEDPKTGLLFGLGHDDYIRQRNKHQEKLEASDLHLDELVNKLGYLDLRDFVALNKYILEAKNHKEYINQAKAQLLNTALKKLNDYKRIEVNSHFKKIDQQTTNSNEKKDKKVEYLLESVDGSKELFYKFYYKIKQFNESEQDLTMDEFDKYNKIMESLKDDKDKKTDNTTANNFDAYMDSLVKTYREERTKIIKLDKQEIQDKINHIFERIKGDPKYAIEKSTGELNALLPIIQYYCFFNKYKKIYIPTNVETERLIVNIF